MTLLTGGSKRFWESGGIWVYDLLAPPGVQSVRQRGAGSPVQIKGENFRNVTGVFFGGVPAESFSVPNGTKIKAVPPPGAGTVDVTVTTEAGTSLVWPGDSYTY